jgi:hypothetical protein
MRVTDASHIIVVLGRMSRYPVAGIAWLTVQYLLGLGRLGHEVWYVEVDAGDAPYVSGMMERFGLGRRWAVDTRRVDGASRGLTLAQLDRLYREAALIVNLHGGTKPLDEHVQTGRLLYLETDPVELAVDIHAGARGSIDFLAAHASFFTWGENYGNPDCGLPRLDGFPFRPTRQPVVVDLWQHAREGPATMFTTIGNWRQPYRDVELDGVTYHWSKHLEFLKFIDLPERTGQSFELALSSYDDADRRLLEGVGWRVFDAAALSDDPDKYRAYVAGSRGEFTVAKDQNVRLRTGWVGDRSPTYLAAGRPVILQDTGFGVALPTGEGLFSFSTMDEIVHAVESINGDYERHSRAASEIAREFFGHDVVLPRLLAEVGL